MCAGHTWADVEGVSHEVVSSVQGAAGAEATVLTCARYHWSVEYFEDLRNVNHCEFIVMKQSKTNTKYILQNELRTWSELKRRAAAAGGGSSTSTTPSRTHSQSALTESPTIPIRRWGGCVNGCNHDKANWPKRPMRKNTVEYLGQPAQSTTASPPIEEQEDHPVAAQDGTNAPIIEEPTPSKLGRKHSTKVTQATALPPTPASPNDASNDASTSDEDSAPRNASVPRTSAILRHLQPPQRTPGEGFSDDSDYFPGMQHLSASTNGKSRLRATSKQRERQQSKERKLARKKTEQSWKEESGMGSGRRADALGDGDGAGTSGVDDAANALNAKPGQAEVESSKEEDRGEPILREALKGNMQVEQREGEEATEGESKIGESEIEKLEEKEGSVREQVY